MNIFHELGIRDGKDRMNEEVIYNIARAYTLFDNFLTRFLADYGLSPTKFNILLMVKHVGKDKGLSQQQISKLLIVTTSNMTRMIDKLEKEGYVERIAQKGDRRVNIIKITAKGSELLDKIWPYYKEEIDNMIGSSFSGKERTQLNGLLEKVKDTIKVKHHENGGGYERK